MRKFKSLTRLLIFYASSLLIMLVLYYVMLISVLKTNNRYYSQVVFDALHHELTKSPAVTDAEIFTILEEPFFADINYQLVLIMPSGQSYIHSHNPSQEQNFTTASFPSIPLSAEFSDQPYKLTSTFLTGIIKLKAGHQVHVVLRHKPTTISWLSYRYWLPLITAIALFSIVVLYMFKRRLNWLQLLHYIENMTTTAKDDYTFSPFAKKDDASTPEFLRLGHALGRVSYQLHSNYRHIKTLSHRLERLVKHAPLPMLMIMRQGHISFFNQRFEQIFTTTFKRGTHYSLTDFVTGSDETTQQLLQKLSLQRVARTLLVYGLDNNSAYQLHIKPWFGEHDQIHGFTVMLNNVNNLVKQSTDLQVKNQQLTLEIKEFAQLRSLIGHELRTPLTAIIGTLDLIEAANLSVRQQEILTTLKQSSHSMVAMLNDMLDVAKIKAGKAQIVNEPTDIFKLGQHISDLITSNARQKNLDLLYLFMPESPRFINTDNNRLQQILLNLLTNAIKFTESGYVALIIEPISWQQIFEGSETSPALSTGKMFKRLNQDLAKKISTPTDKAHNQHQWIRFSIKDTGIGISETEQHELFSYFHQANAKISHKFGGTGLGLAICNSFAQLLGGFIQVNSDSGLGSTFELYLPCQAPTYQPAYSFDSTMMPIYFIAIVKYKVCLEYLQRLCKHLSITADIYTLDTIPTVEYLKDKLANSKGEFAPVLLLDSISYEHPSIVSDGPSDPTAKKETESNNRYDLSEFLTFNVPKILMSREPETAIASTYLDEFDGFLNKPLDTTLLLTEMIRLTQPNHLIKPPTTLQTPIKITSQDRVTYLPNVIEPFEPQDTTTIPLILVVEDNLVNQKIICKLLERLGYRTTMAENGQQALDQLALVSDIALILMDCRMPIMNGMQATRAIRNQGIDLPIIALTANNSEEDREICYQSGMNDFLTKPIDKDKLQSLLERFIIS